MCCQGVVIPDQSVCFHGIVKPDHLSETNVTMVLSYLTIHWEPKDDLDGLLNRWSAYIQQEANAHVPDHQIRFVCAGCCGGHR